MVSVIEVFDMSHLVFDILVRCIAAGSGPLFYSLLRVHGNGSAKVCAQCSIDSDIV